MSREAPVYCLSELADSIGARLQGNPDCKISCLAPLATATSGSLTYFFNPKWRKFLKDTEASAVILTTQDADGYSGNALIVDLPELAFAKAAALFEKRQRVTVGVHSTAILGDAAEIAKGASIGAYCVLGDRVKVGVRTAIHPGCVIGDDVVIGDDCVIYPRVTVYHDVMLGHRVMVHSGAVLGADGFGLAHDEKKHWVRIPQLGTLVIQDDIDIGANTTIDRGALNDTKIGAGVKIDNQVQIGHNVVIGEHSAIAGCAGIAGSTKIGSYCMIGGGVGINGHIQIADGAIISGMSSVVRSIDTAGVYSGSMLTQTNKAWRKNMVALTRLFDLEKRVKCIENQRSE